ncbi:hypothetical protein SOVF_036910 [Spinacia oleracea]|nr:hypothetical protein SOVF_036910 [Spinacia oleracea]
MSSRIPFLSKRANIFSAFLKPFDAMAEAILMAVTKSVLGKLASFTGDIALTSATEEIRAAKSAKKDLKIIASKLSAICAVLHDAEQRLYTNESIKIWLRDLKDVVYDIDDLLDEVATYALQCSANKGHVLIQLRYYFSSSNPFIFRLELSHKIKDLREKIEDIVAKKNEFGLTEHPVEIKPVERNPLDACAYVNMSDIIGRNDDRVGIVSMLLAIDALNHLPVIPIVGLGGVGKTALAKLVYHDEWVVRAFDIKLWACISHKFDMQKIMEDVVKSAVDDNLSGLSLGRTVEKLQKLLRGKKYFLVLDDIWVHDIAVWAEFKNILAVGKAGSVLLVTTRHANVASVVGTVEPYNLVGLSDQNSWSIFKQLAFMEGDEKRYPDLVHIGRSIVEKCVGVPLLIKTLASFLRGVRDKKEWQQVNKKGSLVEVQTQSTDVMRVLKLSYDKLPSHLKPCFVYCSLYVKASGIYPRVLSNYWSALGLLQQSDKDHKNEVNGYNYLTDLIARSLLQELWVFFDGTVFCCQMHDLLHDLATNIIGEELAVVTCNELKVSEMSRHLVWGYEARDGLLEKEFPKELVKAKKVLTFRFGYKMGQISKSFLRDIITSLERLRILDLGNSYFEELPELIGNLKHLRYLDLGNNYMLKKLPSTICQLLNLQTFHIYGCKQLKELPKDMNRLVSLGDLSVTTSQMCLADSKINGLSSLRRLVLYSCKGLTSLWDGASVLCITSLRELQINNCSKLASLPNSMNQLVVLERLVISYCEELDLEVGKGLHGLHNLQTLEIVGVPKLGSLPDGIQSAASSLINLSLGCCTSITQLPHWLQHFTRLRRLHIYSCHNLLALPEGFGHLHSLETLRIRNCSHLTTRCAKPCGEDFSYIQHVHEIFLDNQRL